MKFRPETGTFPGGIEISLDTVPGFVFLGYRHTADAIGRLENAKVEADKFDKMLFFIPGEFWASFFTT